MVVVERLQHLNVLCYDQDIVAGSIEVFMPVMPQTETLQNACSCIGNDHFSHNLWLFALHPPNENYNLFVILKIFISLKHTVF